MSAKKPQSRHSSQQKSSNKKKFALFPIALILIAPFVVAGVVGTGAMQFENRNSFCASCHTEPESVYYQRETAAPADLASFHAGKNTRCIDCHSGKGYPGRAAALILGARDLFAFVSKHYAQPAPLTQPISDSHCLKCHSDLAAKRDFNNHFHVFLSQWQAQDPNAACCVDCHESHITTGDVSIAFLNQGDARQVCDKCHAFAGR